MLGNLLNNDAFRIFAAATTTITNLNECFHHAIKLKSVHWISINTYFHLFSPSVFFPLIHSNTVESLSLLYVTLEYGLWMYYDDFAVDLKVRIAIWLNKVLFFQAIHIRFIVLLSVYVAREKNMPWNNMFNIYFYYINGFSYRNRPFYHDNIHLRTTVAYRIAAKCLKWEFNVE